MRIERIKELCSFTTPDGSKAQMKVEVALDNRDFFVDDATLRAKLEGEIDGLVFPKPVSAEFSGPATIVRWSDGVKTVAVCRECDRCYKVDRNFDGSLADSFVRSFKAVVCRHSRFNGVMAAILKRGYPQLAKTVKHLMDGDAK